MRPTKMNNNSRSASMCINLMMFLITIWKTSIQTQDQRILLSIHAVHVTNLSLGRKEVYSLWYVQPMVSCHMPVNAVNSIPRACK
jgi:hypothetical protein